MTIQNTTLFKCRRINQRFVLLTPLRTSTAHLHVCATVAVTVTTTAATTVIVTVTVTVTVTIRVPFQNLGQHGIPMHSGHNHCMLQTKTSLVPSLCLVHRCACLNSHYSPVTRCKNFARGKISPLFLTAKFSPRNSPLPKSPPPL